MHLSGAPRDEDCARPACGTAFPDLPGGEVDAATAAAVARMLWVVALSTARDGGQAATPPVARWACVPAGSAAAVVAACSGPAPDFSDPFLASVEGGTVDALECAEFASEAALVAAVAESLPFLLSEGAPAAVLVIYSLLLTRGVDRAAREMREDPSAPTFVFEDGCSEQALLHLALTGRACNHVDDSHWAGWTGRPLVGFLTSAPGFTPGECFRRPSLPVFVLQAGGHYTAVWSHDAAAAAVEDTPPARGPAPAAASAEAAAEAAAGGGATPDGAAEAAAKSGAGAADPAPGATSAWEASPPVFRFWHCNGLHPPGAGGRPARVARFDLGMYGPLAPPAGAAADPAAEAAEAAEAAAEAAESEREASNRARKVRRVLQHRPVRGGTREAGPFEFLVVCDKGGSMEASGLDLPPYWPARWYCRDCTLRGDWAGYNAEEAMECGACWKPAAVCGWAHWLGEAQLPRDSLLTWRRAHAPEALQVMRVRWPRAEAVWHGPPPALFG